MLAERLGATVPPGAKHALMSTHNCMAQSGNDSFIELIAPDPEAPPPARPRWFSLDDPATRARISERPRPLLWVVGVDDLDATVAAAPLDLGEIVFFRRGARSWRLTVPRDGSVIEGGLVPAFIEWSPGAHPATGHPDIGVRLDRIEIAHPDPAALGATFASLGISHLAALTEGPRSLAFVLTAPAGTVRLD